MAIVVKPFDEARGVERITITNKGGASVGILTFGATVQQLWVPDRSGKLTDVVLGYPDVRGYEQNGGYIGATIGRYANRIGGSAFTMDGVRYTLEANEGENHLHGGDTARFDRRNFDYEIVDDNTVEFRCVSPDGEGGYPGTLETRVAMRFDDDNALTLTYRAVSDKKTPVNLTNHAYFNLNGEGGETILNHIMTLNCSGYTEVDAGCIPTGGVADVTGTPFDFRTPTAVGARIADDDVQLKNGNGYDHNFAIDGEGMRVAAVTKSPVTGIVLTTETDLPGVQFYSGNGIDSNTGKSRSYGKHDGLCLETQFFPDSPNRPEFPFSFLEAGEEWHYTTVYRFTAE